MSLNTTIQLDGLETSQLIKFFILNNLPIKDWVPIEKSLIDNDNVLTFRIIKTDDNELEVEFKKNNKLSGVANTYNFGIILELKDIFRLYTFETDDANYNISIKPFHGKNGTLYYAHLEGAKDSLSYDDKNYIRNIKLYTDKDDNAEQLWGIVIPMLSTIYNFFHMHEVLRLTRDKLYYYGYDEELSIIEYNKLKEADIFKVDNFNKISSGLLLYMINTFLNKRSSVTNDFLKDIELISGKLASGYYNYIY